MPHVLLQAELHLGISNRAVAATRMNASSSRSHAIFTIHVQQRRIVSATAGSPSKAQGEGEGVGQAASEPVEELVEAHMVFVDLAGKKDKEGFCLNGCSDQTSTELVEEILEVYIVTVDVAHKET